MNKVKSLGQNIFCLIVLALLFQCNNIKDVKAENLSEENAKTLKISSNDIVQIKYTEYALSDLADAKTKDWLHFQNMQDKIELLKKGDLSFLKDDNTILKSLISDLKNEIPEPLNTTSISVRLIVLETALLKLAEILNLKNISKQVVLNNIKDLLIANNNLLHQINKHVEKKSQNIVKPK